LHCCWCSTPESQKTEPELGVYPAKCIQCGLCVPVCPVHAVTLVEGKPIIDRATCTVCGKCAEVCNAQALVVLGHKMTVAQLVAEVKKTKLSSIIPTAELLSPAVNRFLFRLCAEITPGF